LTADGDHDELGGTRSRLPLLIGVLLAAVIVVLLVARLA
jgi:hypothetical protein